MTIVKWKDITKEQPKDDKQYFVAEEVFLKFTNQTIRKVDILKPSRFEQKFSKATMLRKVTHWAEIPSPFDEKNALSPWHDLQKESPEFSNENKRFLISVEKLILCKKGIKERLKKTLIVSSDCRGFKRNAFPPTTNKFMAWAYLPELPIED